MKIAGVKTGAERGEILELAHQKKLEEAVKMETAKLPESVEEFKGFGTWARNIVIKDFSFTAKGTPLKGKWANNVYSGTGTIEVHRRHLANDRVLSPRAMSFEVKFEDDLDAWGMPDLKVTALKLT